MTSRAVLPPFPVFLDSDGTPLENGYVYIGAENLDPISNPISVYWDDALTIPAAQPIRTIGGYPSRAGSPSAFFADANYSITVKDKNGSVVLNDPSVSINDEVEKLRTDIAASSGSSLIGFIQDGAGASAQTVEQALRIWVTPQMFGATGDGVADDSDAIQAAIDYVVDSVTQLGFTQIWSGATYASSVTGSVIFPRGTYKVTKTIKTNGACYLVGAGAQSSVIAEGAGFVGDNILDIGFTTGTTPAEKFWTWGGGASGLKIAGLGKTKVGIFTWRHHTYKFDDVTVSGCSVGAWLEGGYTGLLSSCSIMDNVVGVRASLANAPSPIYEEPNDITFLKCNVFSNETGYEFDNSTNINIIGGVIQNHTGAAINCTGLVRQLNVSGCYFELNNTGSLKTAYIVGTVRILNVSSTFINLASKRLIDTASMTHASVTDSELFSDGTVVYIPTGASLETLRYRNVRPLFSLTLSSYIIDNQKAGFIPFPLELGDFRATAGVNYSEQLKRAFNGGTGTIIFTADVDIRWTVDFPCRITSISTGVGINSSIAASTAMTITSSDVSVEGLKIQAAGSGVAVAFVGASRGRLNGCNIVSATPTNGLITVDAASSKIRITNNNYNRTGGTGKSTTISGAACFYAGNISYGNTTTVTLDASSSGCKAISLDEVVTNSGTGNALL